MKFVNNLHVSNSNTYQLIGKCYWIGKLVAKSSKKGGKFSVKRTS